MSYPHTSYQHVENKSIKSVIETLQSPVISAAYFVVLLVSVFLPEIWTVADAPDSLEPVFISIMGVIMGFMLIEIYCESVVHKEYVYSLMFWIDICAVLTIVVDITLPNRGNSHFHYVVDVIRAGKAARWAARFFAVFVVYMWGLMKPCIDKVKHFCPAPIDAFDRFVDGTTYRPSLIEIKGVHSRVSYFINLRLLLLTIICVIGVYSMRYRPGDSSPEVWMENVEYLLQNESVTVDSIDSFVRKWDRFYDPKKHCMRLVKVHLESPWLENGAYKAEFRSMPNRDENAIVYRNRYTVLNSILIADGSAINFNSSNPTGKTAFHIKATYDQTEQSMWFSKMHMTIYVIMMIVLVLFTVSLMYQITKLVVLPLDNVVGKLRGAAATMITSVQRMNSTIVRGTGLLDVDEDGRRILHRNLTKEGQEFVQRVKDIDDEYGGHDSILLNQIHESSVMEGLVTKMTKLAMYASPLSANKLYNAVRDDADLDAHTAEWVVTSYAGRNSSDFSRSRSKSLKSSMMSISLLSPSGSSVFDRSSSLVSSDLDNDFGDEFPQIPMIVRSKSNRMLPQTFTMTSGRAISTDHFVNSDFDVLDNYTNDDLCELMYFIFRQTDLCTIFDIHTTKFFCFAKEICSRYINENPYHHFRHGCDVCHTAFLMVTKVQLHIVLAPTELLALFVAALSHDVGHLGVNNLYLTKSKHLLAIKHNDRSPLENMHCCVLYDVLSDKKCNIFENLTPQQWVDTRKVILQCILGTDMQLHFENMKRLDLFKTRYGDETTEFCRGDAHSIPCLHQDFETSDRTEMGAENRLQLLDAILHSADISNPCKEPQKFLKWTDMVIEEFVQQGEREKLEGLEVSPLCDKDTMNVANAQLGFMEFVVAPQYIVLIQLFPSLYEMGENILANFELWADIRRVELEESSKASDVEELSKLMGQRLPKFREKFRFLKDILKIPIRDVGQIDKATIGCGIGISCITAAEAAALLAAAAAEDALLAQDDTDPDSPRKRNSIRSADVNMISLYAASKDAGDHDSNTESSYRASYKYS